MHKVTETHVMGDKPAPWADDSHDRPNHWKVVLHYKGRRLTVDFWTGSMAGEPTAKDVIDCLTSDTYLGEQNFDEFCGDLGYDRDSRKAFETWRSCQVQGRKVRKLLGDDFDKVAEWSHA